MRRSTRHHEVIMKAYEELLDERAERGEITAKSKGVAMNHANRLFECCLRSLTPEALAAITKPWFPGRGYGVVIDELKGLIEQRPRPKRRVKS